MAGLDRRFMRCTPVEGVWSFTADVVNRMPGYEAVALLYRESYYIPDGVLVRTPSGILAHYHGGAIRSINPRKAIAALERMEGIRQRRAEAIARGEDPEPYIKHKTEQAEAEQALATGHEDDNETD